MHWDQVRLGSLTCNDFFYLRLRDMKMFEHPCCTHLAEEQCHGMAFMRMWHYRNSHMTVHQLWILTRRHRKTFCTSSLTDMTFYNDSAFFRYMSTPMPRLVPPFFSYSYPPYPPSQGKYHWWMLCYGSLWMLSACSCYLLPADRAMNSTPKWNSYCYQKHKIPITLDVRAKKRKWNRYS